MIYRATPSAPRAQVTAKPTIRAPGNVPYLVDNLWEWLRPAEFPSRRTAAFASPSEELARMSQASPQCFVSRVILPEGWPVAQLVGGADRHDVKNHADVTGLRKIIMEQLGSDWLALPVQERGPEATLFTPCLRAQEVEDVIRNSTSLKADDLKSVSTFWKDVALTSYPSITDEIGEIFFEVPADGYRLENVGSRSR